MRFYSLKPNNTTNKIQEVHQQMSCGGGWAGKKWEINMGAYMKKDKTLL